LSAASKLVPRGGYVGITAAAMAHLVYSCFIYKYQLPRSPAATSCHWWLEQSWLQTK